MTESFVIIGAGECGLRAAQALRERGFAGALTLVGDEPHLPYERPPLSKDILTGADAPAPRTVSDAATLAAAAITCLTQSAAARIDRPNRTVVLADGRSLPYDRLLLATGAVPRRLPVSVNGGGGDGTRIHTLRSFDDALRLHAELGAGRHLAIIGGGFIGLELAASARKRGTRVTVIEAQPRILARNVPAEIAAIVDARHRSEGVDLLCGDGLAALRETDAKVAIALNSGRAIEADALVIGIGVVPQIGLAEAAGLAIDNGIAVDATLATSDPDIFAAGDCCSFPLAIYGGRRVRLESWRSAVDQGRHAAGNMLGDAAPIAAVPWFWSDQYDLSLQVAGLAEGAARHVRREIGNGAFILFHLDETGRLLAASGIGPGNAVAKDIRVAELLIAKRAAPDPAQLARPDVKLKSLLAA